MHVNALSGAKICPVFTMTSNQEHLIWKGASANAWKCTRGNNLVACSLWTDQVNISTIFTACYFVIIMQHHVLYTHLIFFSANFFFCQYVLQLDCCSSTRFMQSVVFFLLIH